MTPALGAVGPHEFDTSPRGDDRGLQDFNRRETDKVFGGHFLGPGAEKLINLIALAIQLDLPVSPRRDVIFTYPTASSDLGAVTIRSVLRRRRNRGKCTFDDVRSRRGHGVRCAASRHRAHRMHRSHTDVGVAMFFHDR